MTTARRPPGTITDQEAAHAWAAHRHLELDKIRHLPLGTIATHLCDRGDGRPDPIPQYVLLAIAELETNDD